MVVVLGASVAWRITDSTDEAGPAVAGAGTFPVTDRPPDRVILDAALVMTFVRGERSQVGVLWASNSRYHIGAVAFAAVPPGRWDARLCVDVTGPVGRAPLRLWIREITTGWGIGTTMDELDAEGPWWASWTDGEELYLTGTGRYCVRLPAHIDYWHDVADHGLVLLAAPGQTAGVTYRMRNTPWIELERAR